MNNMREIRIEKVTANIGKKEVGEEVDKAYMLLERLTDSKPVKTISGNKAKTFGVRSGLNVGAKVTLRRKKAEEFLKRMLEAVGNSIKKRSFTKEGNFSFGIDEYLKVKGIKYDPKIGIMGFNITVNLERSGYSIKRQMLKRNVGHNHRITRDEAVEFIKNKFGVEIV